VSYVLYRIRVLFSTLLTHLEYPRQHRPVDRYYKKKDLDYRFSSVRKVLAEGEVTSQRLGGSESTD